MYTRNDSVTSQKSLIFSNSAVRTSNPASSFHLTWSSLSSFLWCSVIAPDRRDLDWFQSCRHHSDLFVRHEAIATWYLAAHKSACNPGCRLGFCERRPRFWYCSWPLGGVLSVGGSVWYMIRNLRCTVAIDSVLANSKTQNAFLFIVNAIFRHDYSLAVEPGSTPRPLVQ